MVYSSVPVGQGVVVCGIGPVWFRYGAVLPSIVKVLFGSGEAKWGGYIQCSPHFFI